MSEEDYASLVETLELLSTPGVLKGVRKAKREIKKGHTYSIEDIFGG
jgi:antitoxin YefM